MTDKPIPPQSPGLREAVEYVVTKFKKDEADGYHTKDREFAITILDKALAAQSPVLPPSGVVAWISPVGLEELKAGRSATISAVAGLWQNEVALYAAPSPALDPDTLEASKSSWSKIDKELSAYIETVRKDLIKKCVAEALRCDTHELFCEADPKTIRKGIASRIRALASPASGGE